MIFPSQLRDLVICPTLQQLGLDSRAARNLLLGTAAVESHGGDYLQQLHGPALGIYQMEPRTHDDIWEHFLRQPRRQALGERIFALHVIGGAEEMAWNLRYATAMARAHYLRVPEPLPDADDGWALGRYWKKHWNTYLGAGTVDQFRAAYARLVEAYGTHQEQEPC